MAARIPAGFRRVITAAAGSNVIEWYDFYIFGSFGRDLVGQVLRKKPPGGGAAQHHRAVHCRGFLIRPLGAPNCAPVRLDGRPRRPQIHSSSVH